MSFFDFIHKVRTEVTALSLESLKNLIAGRMDAEGLDLFLWFGLVLIWEHFQSNRSRRGSQKLVYIVWLLILFICEAVIQQVALLLHRILPSIFPKRDISLLDIGVNMIGVTIALFLSSRWFWKDKN